MRRKNPVEIIENYRRGQARRRPFSLGDLLMGLIVIVFLILIGYITFIAKPELPSLINLNTLTPTLPVTSTERVIMPLAGSTTEVAPTASAMPQPAAPDQPTRVPTNAPTNTATSTATLTVSPTATATPTETTTLTATPILTRDYIVQEGDTLGAIALKYGITVEEIVQLNNLKSATFIYAGQKLLIPIK